MQHVSKYKPLKHYQWGEQCDGWNLVDEVNLSVKLERMPAGTSEVKHYHQKSQQFFFVLKGIASFEFENAVTEINKEEGIHITPGVIHRISNRNSEELEFILYSQPSTIHDRINCE